MAAITGDERGGPERSGGRSAAANGRSETTSEELQKQKQLFGCASRFFRPPRSSRFHAAFGP